MHELVRAYAAAHPGDVGVFTSSWKDRPADGTAQELGARVVDRRIPVSLLNLLWHRLEWPPVEFLAGNCDVVHAAHPLLIPARRAAQIVTVHDLFFLAHPERTRAEIRRDYPALTEGHVRRADAVVTPSAYTGSLVEALGVPADRIYVCPPAAPRWSSLGQSPNLPADGYVLFFGTLEPRKNLGALLDAYERLLARRTTPLPNLVIAGRATPDAAEWLERISRAPLAGRVTHRGFIEHHERERLYQGARLLVMPSLDEGFGIPALEALAAGVPVLVSNRGALPEVVGDAGTIADPDDVDAFSTALQRLIEDEACATARAEAGLARAKTFTWDRTVRRLHEAYVDAVARREAR